MSSPVPEEAIDAAMEAWGVNGNKHQRDVVVTILKAAAPYFYAACGRADYGQHPKDADSEDPRVKNVMHDVAELAAKSGRFDLATSGVIHPMNDPRMGPPNPPNPTWNRPFG